MFYLKFKNLTILIILGSTFVSKGSNCYEIDEEFKDEIIAVIQHLFKPENFDTKKANNLELKGSNFYEYIRHQVSSYHKLKIQNNANSENQIERSKG